jgi:hypothetical protein
VAVVEDAVVPVLSVPVVELVAPLEPVVPAVVPPLLPVVPVPFVPVVLDPVVPVPDVVVVLVSVGVAPVTPLDELEPVVPVVPVVPSAMKFLLVVGLEMIGTATPLRAGPFPWALHVPRRRLSGQVPPRRKIQTPQSGDSWTKRRTTYAMLR